MRKPQTKLGRPPIAPAPMLRLTVSLDKDTVTQARKLGKGNLSAGLRLAVYKLTGE